MADDRIIQGIPRIAEMYKALAERRGIFFFNAGALPLSYDGVHLSEEGNRMLAKKLCEKLTGCRQP